MSLGSSQAHSGEGLLHEDYLAFLDLVLSGCLLGVQVHLEFLFDLRSLRLALLRGGQDLGLDALLSLLAVRFHSLGGLLARGAELLGVHDLHLVGLAQHVRRFRKGLEQLLVPVVHLLCHGAVPQSIEHGHHGEEGEGNERECKAKVEHAASVRRQRRCRQEHSPAGRLPWLRARGLRRCNTPEAGHEGWANGAQDECCTRQQAGGQDGRLSAADHGGRKDSEAMLT
mmetsp:Transcript_67215/g.218871  ORF Transcript_67215/g.218871 Transcript_67215/m.218871 type:complete len:227 (-) Transcript_67215:18-698(-)